MALIHSFNAKRLWYIVIFSITISRKVPFIDFRAFNSSLSVIGLRVLSTFATLSEINLIKHPSTTQNFYS